MKYLFFSVFFCQSISIFGQILDNYRGRLFGDECMFNENFIRDNKIKKISGSFSKKEEMQIIENLYTVEIYTFGLNGKPLEYLKSFRTRGGTIDTTAESFKYNNLDEIIQKTRHVTGGYNSIQYNYDKEGNITEEKIVRGQWNSSSGNPRETVVKTERSRHEVIQDSILVRTYLNTEGQAYRIRETVYGKMGIKRYEEMRYVLTNKKDITNYQYDDYGRLIKMIKVSNVAGNNTNTYTIDYDTLGNVERAKYYKNGKLLESQEYIYDPATLLLDARLIKDEEKSTIYITRYTYEYY
jgi:hypothetical protein